MLKQSPSRNQRTKGFKVKQGFKLFILVAIGIWLIYQLKHSHDKKKKVVYETKILGRKGFRPVKKPYELIDDTDESRPERVKEQSGGGGGDDDLTGHDRDRDRVEEEESEEVEDLIDEEDKENEDDNNLLEDQGHVEGEKETEGTSQKHYRGNNGRESRRKLKEEVDNSEKQHKKILFPTNYLSPKLVDNVGIEHGSSANVLPAKGKDGVLNFADSESGSNSDSLLD